jgi:hypothetical protein
LVRFIRVISNFLPTLDVLYRGCRLVQSLLAGLQSPSFFVYHSHWRCLVGRQDGSQVWMARLLSTIFLIFVFLFVHSHMCLCLGAIDDVSQGCCDYKLVLLLQPPAPLFQGSLFLLFMWIIGLRSFRGVDVAPDDMLFLFLCTLSILLYCQFVIL